MIDAFFAGCYRSIDSKALYLEMKGPPASPEEQTPLSDERVRQVFECIVVMSKQGSRGHLPSQQRHRYVSTWQ